MALRHACCNGYGSVSKFQQEEDLSLAVVSVSVGHLHCSQGILDTEFAALKILALTEFSVWKVWEETLRRQ